MSSCMYRLQSSWGVSSVRDPILKMRKPPLLNQIIYLQIILCYLLLLFCFVLFS
jgi:hypothetical protein